MTSWRDQDGAAADAGAAVPGRDVLRPGAGDVPRLGYLRVWAKLTAGLADLDLPCPSEKALRDLRRRLGPAPVKALFEVVAGPLAPPGTPGVFFRGLRTVAFDGLNSVKVPDSGRNRCWLGRTVPAGVGRVSGAAADGPGRDRHPRPARRRARSAGDRDEGRWPGGCCRCCARGCCCCDRAYDAAFLREVAATGALCWPRQVHPPPVGPGPPARRLLPVVPGRADGPDHRGQPDVTGADGSRLRDGYRLITTLLDCRRYPAGGAGPALP